MDSLKAISKETHINIVLVVALIGMVWATSRWVADYEHRIEVLEERQAELEERLRGMERN